MPQEQALGELLSAPQLCIQPHVKLEVTFFFLRPEVKKQLCCDKYTHTKEKHIEKDPGKGNDMHSELKN